MNAPRSYSQAGQDLWVASRLKTPGTFLDIGCCHPSELSNTYLLEQLGWRGWGVDCDANAAAMCKAQRPAFRVVCEDATKVDYHALVGGYLVDYLSLDVDHDSLGALKRLLECGVGFVMATIEHDAYRFGDELRAEQRQLLLGLGYVLELPDVKNAHCEFEDWWRHRYIAAPGAL